MKSSTTFKLDDFKFIFTKSNSDNDGRVINCMIDDFVRNNKSRSMASFELGQALYFSLIKFCNAVLGNSSSGLLEVPSFKIPTINVGDRQKGRLKASSVIDCKAAEKSIDRALNFAF